jgi:hypothetical protein
MTDPKTNDPRHMRLFELIRQGNLAQATAMRVKRRDRQAVEQSAPGWVPEDLAATLSAA